MNFLKDFDGFYIENITFNAEPNQLIAIVGPVGSGKVLTNLSIIESHIKVFDSETKILELFAYGTNERNANH